MEFSRYRAVCLYANSMGCLVIRQCGKSPHLPYHAVSAFHGASFLQELLKLLELQQKILKGKEKKGGGRNGMRKSEKKVTI